MDKLTPEDYEIGQSVQIKKHPAYKGVSGVIDSQTLNYVVIELDKNSIIGVPEGASEHYENNEKPKLLIDPNDIFKL